MCVGSAGSREGAQGCGHCWELSRGEETPRNPQIRVHTVNEEAKSVPCLLQSDYQGGPVVPAPNHHFAELRHQQQQIIVKLSSPGAEHEHEKFQPRGKKNTNWFQKAAETNEKKCLK